MPYIYKITNQINQKIYIGKTSYSIEKRWKEHCQDYKKNLDKPLYKAFNKYGLENFKIEEIEQVKTDEEACQREVYWIAFYNSYHYGYNATLGGDGKQLFDSTQILALWNEGLSSGQIAKIIGCSINCVQDNLMIFGISGKERVQRGIELSKKITSKKILMLSKENEILKIFNSSREAARFLIQEFNLSSSSEGGYSSHIIEVCKGKRKTCQGYKWKYGGLV